MSETVIPKMREETRRVKIVFELKKDLQENEVVCEHCHGTGLEIADNVYGIRGDITHIGVRFPYKHQSLRVCKYCYNGVQEKCPSCGSLRGKQDRECSCGCSDREREEKRKKESEERWVQADKMPVDEALNGFGCLYVDDIDKYVFNKDELEDLIEEYELVNPKIYGTVELGVQVDAYNVIEQACSGLHDEAAARCDAVSLQAVLDEWGKKQAGATTYVPYYKMGVLLTASEDGNNE